ncbi:MAG: formate dehydrogenase accessory sulfurtransferase FdhD [Saprospiraceae bacterium]|nr:formate dehydrogenase accessory sulfurtransferase FdhD [Saprospiraceae bacterium]
MKSVINKKISRHLADSNQDVEDVLTIEEPLEIRVKYHTQHGIHRIMSLAVTMRTPGEDEFLARGFLFTESIIASQSDIVQVDQLEDNIILVTLQDRIQFDAQKLQRNFYTTSSCGVCGKASIESIHSDTIYLPWSSKFTINKAHLYKLPERLRQQQAQFSQTGGIHACALIDSSGNIVLVKEDVGRHNAMDKLIGANEKYPIADCMVLVSGRASFELVQKASKAGIPLMAAIGAPSSLAVQLAEEQGMGLVGFLRNNSFNLYTGQDRII